MIDTSIPLGLSETFELLIKNNTVQKINFSDSLVSLDNCTVHGIALQKTFNGKTIKGSDALLLADLQKGFLTLANRNNKRTNVQIPLEILINAGIASILYLKPIEINIRECFVEFPQIAGVALGAAGRVVVFTIFYNRDK